MMSHSPHKVLKLVCQSIVEIFANFVAKVLNKIWIFSEPIFHDFLFNT